MPYMMYHTTGFGPLPGIHMLAATLSVAGLILLLLWAAKTLTQGQLKTWGIALLVIGIVVCLLTVILGGQWHGQYRKNMPMMNDMMQEMMNEMMDDDGMHMMNVGDDAMSMSMDDMASMLEGKTGDEFDKAFIEGMIPHHQGAIDMAQAALENAGHEEIRQLARDIIASQQREIDDMNRWLDEWNLRE